MAGDFEERYLDVLQNLEFAIVSVYRQLPELLDYDVEAALDALIARYQAEQLQRTPRPISLNERRQQVFVAVEEVCEWRLGRPSAFGEGQDLPEGGPAPRSVEEIVACLKRIRKSVQRWNKQGGRQGYLRFVVQFVK